MPDEEEQQPTNRLIYKSGAGDESAVRLPVRRQDGAGDPACHQRDPGLTYRSAGCNTPEGWTWRSSDRRHVGDIESAALPRPLRQLSLRLGPNNAAFVHLTTTCRGLPPPAKLRQTDPAFWCRDYAGSACSPTPAVRRADRAGARRRAREDLACSPAVPRVGRDLDARRGHHLPRCRACCTSRGLDGLICDKLRLTPPPT